jgi:hypothetical protein
VGYGVVSLNGFMIGGSTYLPDLRPDVLFILIDRLGTVIGRSLVDSLAKMDALIQLTGIGQREYCAGI